MMVVKDSDLPDILSVVARFLDLTIPPSLQAGGASPLSDNETVGAFTVEHALDLPVPGITLKQNAADQDRKIIEPPLKV